MLSRPRWSGKAGSSGVSYGGGVVASWRGGYGASQGIGVGGLIGQLAKGWNDSPKTFRSAASTSGQARVNSQNAASSPSTGVAARTIPLIGDRANISIPLERIRSASALLSAGFLGNTTTSRGTNRCTGTTFPWAAAGATMPRHHPKHEERHTRHSDVSIELHPVFPLARWIGPPWWPAPLEGRWMGDRTSFSHYPRSI